jgi:malonyl-CoA O-methyltransferase
MLQWCQPQDDFFRECYRVLRPGGLLMFTSFGPDTLKELRQAWRAVDNETHVHEFEDMHNAGDALLRCGYAEPVMDMEMLTATYADLAALLRDLRGIGATNAESVRPKGLYGRSSFVQLSSGYESFRDKQGRLPATYEVIYGHAWIPPVKASALPSMTIPVKDI